MAERYWFKRKRYGYGWTPASTAGWLTFLAMMAIVLGGALVLAVIQPEGPWPVVIYLGVVALATAGLLFVTIRKGPKARWRWGPQPGDDPDEDL